MNLTPIFGETATVWVIIPLLIFCARITDVSIGTIRLIVIGKGMKALATLLGFFEVLIWLIAISQILQNLTHWFYYIAYAGGFAAGNFVGMAIEQRLALGNVILRIITHRDAAALMEALLNEDYGVTALDAQGRFGPVKILFTLIPRNDLPRIVALVNSHNPRAFYSIEDVRFVSEGVFPARRGGLKLREMFFRKFVKKAK